MGMEVKIPGTGMGPGVTGTACLEWQQPGVRLCHLNSELDLFSGVRGLGASCWGSAGSGLDMAMLV